jgi:hypothetical protein
MQLIVSMVAAKGNKAIFKLALRLQALVSIVSGASLLIWGWIEYINLKQEHCGVFAGMSTGLLACIFLIFGSLSLPLPVLTAFRKLHDPNKVTSGEARAVELAEADGSRPGPPGSCPEPSPKPPEDSPPAVPPNIIGA